MTGKYDDIIRLPHHVSHAHPPMPPLTRAAQFSPFAALTGYEAALAETARRTERRIDLSDDEKAELNLRLRLLADTVAQHPRVTFTIFVPDDKKTGGAYVTRTGRIRRIDEVEQRIVLMDGNMIGFEEIALW